MKDIFLKLMFSTRKKYMNFIMIYNFCQKEWRLTMLVTNLCNKNEYVIHIRNLKQALNHGLIFRKIHRVIKFKQTNTERRQKAKSYFEKNFFRSMNKTGFGKTL